MREKRHEKNNGPWPGVFFWGGFGLNSACWRKTAAPNRREVILMDWVVILGEDPEVHLKQHVEGTFFAAILGGPKRS